MLRKAFLPISWIDSGILLNSINDEHPYKNSFGILRRSVFCGNVVTDRRFVQFEKIVVSKSIFAVWMECDIFDRSATKKAKYRPIL